MPTVVRWHLELGGEVVARIAHADEYEFPWTYGVPVELPDFERFRAYFTDPDTWSDDDLEMESLSREVQLRGGSLLRDLQSEVLHQPVTLNQNREYLWFRIG